jgi:AraC-like DNA-binding protein
MRDALIFVCFITNFSIYTLADLTQSNQKYVSDAINSVLNKNFRSFLNEYRIKEAQRLLSEPDALKFSINAVATKIGFKSPTAFRNTFKELTGVTPSFYLKSIHNQKTEYY